MPQAAQKMKLYCPICDKRTEHTESQKLGKVGLLCSCNRFQPVNSINQKGQNMARAKQSGTLTGSKHFKKPELENNNPLETVANIASNVGQFTQSVATGVQTSTDNLKSVGKGLRSIRNSFQNGSSLVTDESDTSLKKASDISSKYGVNEINVSELLGTDPYKADADIPEMKASDANKEKLRIQRQNNALDVRLEKIKQSRKVVDIATEQRRLIGDFVDFATVGIETATKVVKHQIADTKYRVEQSKLEQTEEQLEQQQIATQGTLNLTEGIRQEWQLKLENQQAKNDRLRLDIEGTIQNTERRRQEIEAMLLEA
jgi:hypothetical protein